MKIFFAEGKPDYTSYTFNYGIYCLKESQGELPSIYDQGFLPYSGDVNLESEIFYLARSLRVDLDRFVDSSENRRVQRKVDELNIELELFEKPELINSDPTFLTFAQSYAASRIGQDNMSAERFSYILSRQTGSHIFRFTSKNNPVGYVLTCFEGHTLHYWFSYFNLDLMKSHSLGKWMMWKIIDWAKNKGLSYVYLGTCYGEKSLYKVRDHKGLSFFDGNCWNQDMKLLKAWCKSDDQKGRLDRLKESEDKNAYLNGITET